MALKQFNPTSPGRRQLVLVDKSELHKGKPEKSLVEGLTKSGGRGGGSRVAVRFRGHLGRRSDVKKAIVTLADGQSIDITTGL